VNTTQFQSPRSNQAIAALALGDRQTAARLLADVVDDSVTAGVVVPADLHFRLARTLFELGRLGDAETRAKQGLAQAGNDFALNNLLGVVLKHLQRFEEALQALERARQAQPDNLAPLINAGNVWLEMGDGPRALTAFSRLVQAAPQEVEFVRLLGQAMRLTGDYEGALTRLEQARQIDSGKDRAWIDAAALLRELGRHDEAVQLIEQALAAVTNKSGLAIAKAQVLRAAGRLPQARDYLMRVLASQPDCAWAHFQLGRTLAPYDRDSANGHLREALRLEPAHLDYRVELADSLDRTRGPREAEHIDEGYRIARECVAAGGNLRPHAAVLRSILERCGDYELAGRLGSFETLGMHWARTNQPAALHHQLGRVGTLKERHQLVEHHRLWGQSCQDKAARTPLRRTPVQAGRQRIRVGLMSSDLRDHPVSYFALPLIEGYDRSRFEFYAYSWSTVKPDRIQQRIAQQVQAFRHAPGASARDAAQLIADDQLDILFELGGTTHMNKLEAMAWKPAPLQASWLGYPHSSGLSHIDLILVDPFLKPDDPALLIESPFALQRSWVVLGELGFSERDEILPGTPQERLGALTYGTMNNPYKFRPETLATWAEVVRRTEGARFVFVRPEGATEAFRENMWRAFEAGGVGRDRVEFIPVRGTHRQHYNAIDIALDTFPQTGGTTTCECLWMGVPVVTLVGPAFFERLSYSNLSNAGLGDLCAFSREAYIDTALALAADLPRRQALRGGLREQIRQQPLGRADWFVDDFQQTVLSALGRGSPTHLQAQVQANVPSRASA
jgi:predicted O-linked N-acetylglucosamine transferase (SPINDLY family)